MSAGFQNYLEDTYVFPGNVTCLIDRFSVTLYRRLLVWASAQYNVYDSHYGRPNSSSCFTSWLSY